MSIQTLPQREEMIQAFRSKDMSYQGVFFTGVRSTGIFCRIGCPARAPNPNQLEFFATARDALFGGFRPCKRCRPIEPAGQPPAWLRTLLDAVDSDPETRWSDSDIRSSSPATGSCPPLVPEKPRDDLPCIRASPAIGSGARPHPKRKFRRVRSTGSRL